MSKIVILGTSHSGKTCYFYGMLRKMMVGISGFSIRVEDKDFSKIRDAIRRLGDTKLRPEEGERFPLPSQTTETYKLDLMYNFGLLESFDWDDYPGENIVSKMSEFAVSMKNAHCLLLCVDGEGIAEAADIYGPDETDDLAADLTDRWGCFELNHALASASKQNDSFPAVCVMISKYDKIPNAFRNMETMTEMVKKCFPTLFNDGQGGNSRLVTICPVSLGKDLDKGERLRPVNVEKPICFATYLIQASKQKELQEGYRRQVQKDRENMEEWENLNALGKIIHHKPQIMSETEKATMRGLLQSGERDVTELRNMITPLPLYMNGKDIEWPD